MFRGGDIRRQVRFDARVDGTRPCGDVDDLDLSARFGVYAGMHSSRSCSKSDVFLEQDPATTTIILPTETSSEYPIPRNAHRKGYGAQDATRTIRLYIYILYTLLRFMMCVRNCATRTTSNNITVDGGSGSNEID